MRWTLTFLLAAALCGTFTFAQNPEPKTQNPKSARPELALQVGHNASVKSVAFSPDGKMVASGSEDGTVKLWDAQTGELKRTLTSRGVLTIAFSPDGNALAGGSYQEVKLWDAETGELKRTLTSDGMLTIAFSPDGKTLAGGSFRTVKLWDAQTGDLKRTLKGYSDAVMSVTFSADGKMIASGSGDPENAVKLWDAQTGDLKRTLKGYSRRLTSVAFSPDGKMVVSGSEDDTVKLWDTQTGELKRTLKGDIFGLRSVAFSPDGKTVASGSVDNAVRLWDVQTGVLKRRLKGRTMVFAVAFSPDGKTLADGSYEGVELWDVQTGELKRTLKGHTGSVWSVTFSPDGKTVATGRGGQFGSGDVRLWDTQTGVLKRTLTGHDREVLSVVFSPDSKTLASGSEDNTVRLWDAQTGELKRTLKAELKRSVEAVSDEASSVAFSPDGKTVASGSGEFDKSGEVRLWDVETGKLKRTLTGHSSTVKSVAFSPDGKSLASGSWDKTVRLWDAETGALKRTLMGHTSFVTSVVFSPDGKTAASGSYDATARLWDTETGALKRTLTGHSSVVWSVTFSPDGKMLASGSGDEVKLWDADTGVLKRTLTGHIFYVNSVAFSPAGKTVASGGGDGTGRLWETNSGRLLATLLTLPRSEKEEVATEWLAVTPEGYYDGSAGAGRFIKWRVGNDLFPVEAYEKVFYRPQLVKRVLRGEAVPKAERQVEKFLAGQLIPPIVAFASLRDGQEVTGDAVSVELNATDDGKVTELELLVNGRPVAAKPIEVGAKPIEVGAKPIEVGAKSVPASHKSQHAFKAIVPLPPGETNVTVKTIAYDDEGLLDWHEIRLVRKLATLVTGDVHVLSVGVSQYQNPKFNLKYAARDAQAFASLWERIGQAQNSTQSALYNRVHTTTLTNAQATTAQIRAALSRMVGATTEKDSIVLFLSGHGVQANESDYYFATHEIEASSAASVAQTALPWTDFQKLLREAKAKRVLLFLDACRSGNSLGGQQASSERLAAELLMRNTGVMVFASSRGSEFSYELDERQHGAFTAALIEGLGDGRADLDIGDGRDGVINVEELLTYLRNRVPRLTGNLQTPTCPLMRDFGEPFPLARVK